MMSRTEHKYWANYSLLRLFLASQRRKFSRDKASIIQRHMRICEEIAYA